MRTIKILGLVVAILGLLTAIIALITEGVKLFNELPIQTSQIATVVATLPESSSQNSNSQQDQCQWLQTNFPQSADDAKSKYNLPSDTTFQFIYELCPSVANAFTFKASSIVEIQVPSGGCIDSWPGFTKYVGDVGTPIEDGHGGWRVHKGIVQAPEMTIRILGCK